MKTLDSLAAGKDVPGDVDDDKEWGQKSPPPWFDQAKFDRGIAFFRTHMSSVLFSYLLSLIAGFNLDVFLQTLLFTGQSSSPEISGKRYFATLLYILQWYDSDITDTNSKGYKSLMRVRRIHHHVRMALKKRQKQILLDVVDHNRKAEDRGFLLDDEDNESATSSTSTRENNQLEDSGIVKEEEFAEVDEDDFVYIDFQRPTESRDGSLDDHLSTPSLPSNQVVEKGIHDDDDQRKMFLNQYDMALVQSAFVLGVILYPDWIGINASTEEFEDYVYVWRVFGWYLGIHDRFNICDGSLEEVRSVGAEVRDMCLVPAIKLKSREADIITRAFIEGSHAKFKRQDASISTFLSPAALISISRRPFRMGKEHEPPDFTFFDEFCISLLHIFFAITYYVPPFRKLVNSLLSLPNVMKLLA